MHGWGIEKWFRPQDAVALGAILLVIAIGVAGYLVGNSQGVELEDELASAAAAGETRGTAEGERRGYALGFKSTRESAFRQAYRDGYLSAYTNEFEQAGITAPDKVVVRGP